MQLAQEITLEEFHKLILEMEKEILIMDKGKDPMVLETIRMDQNLRQITTKIKEMEKTTRVTTTTTTITITRATTAT
jgi:hypothetical protein